MKQIFTRNKISNSRSNYCLFVVKIFCRKRSDYKKKNSGASTYTAMYIEAQTKKINKMKKLLKIILLGLAIYLLLPSIEEEKRMQESEKAHIQNNLK